MDGDKTGRVLVTLELLFTRHSVEGRVVPPHGPGEEFGDMLALLSAIEALRPEPVARASVPPEPRPREPDRPGP